MLVSSTLLGIGIGLAFSALGNLIVQAVPPTQTGIASGMNTVMRTLGGALGGQLSATFIADHMANGYPTVTGFTLSFIMAAAFLAVGVVAGLLVPGLPSRDAAPPEGDPAAGELEMAGERSSG
jgi:MFS family permease